jgi:hypothetical protein
MTYAQFVTEYIPDTTYGKHMLYLYLHCLKHNYNFRETFDKQCSIKKEIQEIISYPFTPFTKGYDGAISLLRFLADITQSPLINNEFESEDEDEEFEFEFEFELEEEEEEEEEEEGIVNIIT